jgi:penicillin-binding protein 1A
MGYDSPKKMGSSALETGGGLSLPIWISYMEHALKGVAVTSMPVPEGLISVGNDWFYEEFGKGSGVRSLGLEAETESAGTAPVQPLPAADEKRRILDLFKN